jgi:2'-5' RNA ligase
VAIWVESPLLIALRDRLAAGLRDMLSAQDKQPFRPHVTIQNKVSTEEARRSLIRICRGWHPRSARVEGIDVWEYLGGPWSLHARIPFDPEG